MGATAPVSVTTSLATDGGLVVADLLVVAGYRLAKTAAWRARSAAWLERAAGLLR
jgi:glycine cleavage system aminomethyltransferase T